MPDTFIDGDFSLAQPVGAPRYEYPFRLNGDRVSALFEQDYWQLKATFTPAEFSVEHRGERGFYLVKESPPVEFMAGLLKFTRTFSRIPSQQTEWSSILVPMPEPTGAAGTQGLITRWDTSDNRRPAILTTNYFYGDNTYYRPIKVSPNHAMITNANVIAWTVPNHSFTNSRDIIHIQDGPNAFWIGVAIPYGNAATSWQYANANGINIKYSADFNYGASEHAFCQANRGSFGSGTRYLRCRRVTDFYLPGVSPGIATEADIPLPADQSQSSEFIDALFTGTGDINVQVGELQRWRESPIYMITKTVISVVDIL